MRGSLRPQVLDGALVRVPVQGEAWAEQVPPPPADAEVSVTFTEPEAALVHSDALRLLGYRVAGVQPHHLSDGPAADFLIPLRVIQAHPRWWRALADQAERAFNLSAGPVLADLAEVLRVHRL